MEALSNEALNLSPRFAPVEPSYVAWK